MLGRREMIGRREGGKSKFLGILRILHAVFEKVVRKISSNTLAGRKLWKTFVPKKKEGFGKKERKEGRRDEN